jgi:hypothetical protein
MPDWMSPGLPRCPQCARVCRSWRLCLAQE